MKPVAWIVYDEFGDFMLETTPDGDYDWIPLYPAPTIVKDEQGKVVAVTLTNEEHQVQEVLWQAPRELSDEEVADYLQKKIDHLWKMTESNMKLNLMNIMDDIRLETIDSIKPVIAILKKASEK